MAEIRTILNPDNMDRGAPSPSLSTNPVPTPDKNGYLADAAAMQRMGSDYQQQGAEIFARDETRRKAQEALDKQEKEMLDHYAAQSALVKLNGDLVDLKVGDQGYARVTGDALTDPRLRDTYIAKARQAADKYRDDLTPEQQRLYDNQAEQGITSLNEGILTHQITQIPKQRQAIRDASIASEAQKIAIDPTNSATFESSASTIGNILEEDMNANGTTSPIVRGQIKSERLLQLKQLQIASQTNAGFPEIALHNYETFEKTMPLDPSLRKHAVDALAPQLAATLASADSSLGISIVAKDEAEAKDLAVVSQQLKLPVFVSVGDRSAENAARLTNPVFDNLHTNEKIDILHRAAAYREKDSAEVRASGMQMVNDAKAEGLTKGQVTNMPTDAQIRAAYPARWEQEKASIADSIETGKQIQNLKSYDSSRIQELTKELPASTTGYSERLQYQHNLNTAAESVLTKRREAPIDTAVSEGRVTPFSNDMWGDAGKMADAFSKRVSEVESVRTAYGMPKVGFFSKSEADAYGTMISTAPVTTQLSLMKNLFSGISATSGGRAIIDYDGALDQLKINAPATREAGKYMARGYQARIVPGETMLAGEVLAIGADILSPNKADITEKGTNSSFLMPPEDKLKVDFAARSKDAYKYMPQEVQNLDFQKYKAAYAYFAKRFDINNKDGADPNASTPAFSIASGGVGSYQGTSIVLPYGVGISEFKDAVKPSLVTSAARQNPDASVDVMANQPLRSIGENKYHVVSPSGLVVHNLDGSDFVLYLDGRRPPLPGSPSAPVASVVSEGAGRRHWGIK